MTQTAIEWQKEWQAGEGKGISPCRQVLLIADLAIREETVLDFEVSVVKDAVTGKNREVLDLGYANGWPVIDGKVQYPGVVQICRALKHTPGEERVKMCLHRTTCSICRYTYLVDSSG